MAIEVSPPDRTGAVNTRVLISAAVCALLAITLGITCRVRSQRIQDGMPSIVGVSKSTDGQRAGDARIEFNKCQEELWDSAARSECAGDGFDHRTRRLRDFIASWGDTPSGLTARIALANMIGDGHAGGESWTLLQIVQATTWAGWRVPLAQWTWLVIVARGEHLDDHARIADQMVELMPTLAALDDVDDSELWQHVTGSRPSWDAAGRTPMKNRFLALVLNQVAGWYEESDDERDPLVRLRGERSPSELLSRSIRCWKRIVLEYPSTPEAASAEVCLRMQERATMNWVDWHQWLAAQGYSLEGLSQAAVEHLRGEWRADAKKRCVPGIH